MEFDEQQNESPYVHRGPCKDGQHSGFKPGNPGRPKNTPNKRASKTKRLGPSSRQHRITTLDYTTTAGRVLHQVTADLVSQVGGDPSPAEALLIQSVAIKATRLFLLSEKLLNPETCDLKGDEHALAWLNSMRMDLMALGLERRIRDVTPSLASILKQHAEEDAKPPKRDLEFDE